MIAYRPRKMTEIRKLVEEKLKSHRGRLGFGLNVMNVLDGGDGWLDFIIEPSRKSVSSYDYAKALAEVELELRDDGIEKVFLTPAIPDFGPTARPLSARTANRSVVGKKRVSRKRSPAKGKM